MYVCHTHTVCVSMQLQYQYLHNSIQYIIHNRCFYLACFPFYSYDGSVADAETSVSSFTLLRLFLILCCSVFLSFGTFYFYFYYYYCYSCCLIMFPFMFCILLLFSQLTIFHCQFSFRSMSLSLLSHLISNSRSRTGIYTLLWRRLSLKPYYIHVVAVSIRYTEHIQCSTGF